VVRRREQDGRLCVGVGQRYARRQLQRVQRQREPQRLCLQLSPGGPGRLCRQPHRCGDPQRRFGERRHQAAYREQGLSAQ